LPNVRPDGGRKNYFFEAEMRGRFWVEGAECDVEGRATRETSWSAKALSALR
jgi:hypothetical protein